VRLDDTSMMLVRARRVISSYANQLNVHAYQYRSCLSSPLWCDRQNGKHAKRRIESIAYRLYPSKRDSSLLIEHAYNGAGCRSVGGPAVGYISSRRHSTPRRYSARVESVSPSLLTGVVNREESNGSDAMVAAARIEIPFRSGGGKDALMADEEDADAGTDEASNAIISR
jgi:hypothetical protein